MPLIVFLSGVIWLGLSGAPGEQGFWPILVIAMGFGMLLCRSRAGYAEAVIGGMSQPIVMVMIMAWLLAGMLASLMKAGGLVPALVWLAQQVGVSGVGYAVAAFLITAAVSTSTGTSLGTLIICSPALYPAGGALDADPAVLIGAILGGATFGDNISPVSDTTIASTVSQGARMGDVVRSRLRYALPAAAMALIATVLVGALRQGPNGAATTFQDSLARPDGLPMLIAPGLVIFLLFRHVHLLAGLLCGIAAAVLIGCGLGLVPWDRLIYVDEASFTAGGLLVEGMQRGVGISIFTLLLMGLVAGLESAGVIQRLLAYAGQRIGSPRDAEVWAFGTVSAATLMTTHSVVALLAVGSFVRETGFRQGISPKRRANILDTTVCTYPFLLPYCVPTILAAATTAGAEAYGLPAQTALTAGLFNFHSWGLLLMVLFAVATGWGRHMTSQETLTERRGPWHAADPSSTSGQSPVEGGRPPTEGPPKAEHVEQQARRDPTEKIDWVDLEAEQRALLEASALERRARDKRARPSEGSAD